MVVTKIVNEPIAHSLLTYPAEPAPPSPAQNMQSDARAYMARLRAHIRVLVGKLEAIAKIDAGRSTVKK